jgi:ATP-binding cassette subfamily B protein
VLSSVALGSRIRSFLKPPVEAPALVEAAPGVPLRRILARFGPHLRPLTPALIASFLFVAISPAVAAASIWLFKILVDQVLTPGDFGPFPLIAAAFIGLTLLSGLVSFAASSLSSWISGRFLLSLRLDFFRHLQSLPLDFFERRRMGDVITRLTGDIGSIETLLISSAADGLSYVLRIAFFGGALFVLEPRLALISLVVVPPFFVAARHFSGLLKDASRERRRRSGSIGAVAEESLANLPLVQSYGRQEAEAARFERENMGSFRAQMRTVRLNAVYSPLVSIIEVLAAMLVLGCGALFLSEGSLSLGSLLVFLAYLGNLYGPIRGLGKMSGTIHTAAASAERIMEFLDERPTVVDKPNAMELGRAHGVVELRDVSFGYPGTTRPAVRDLSLLVEPGETVALVGASGAGKTTVAKLLLRFYDPTFGSITLDGHDVRDLSLASLRANVTLLLQDSLVFHGTVRENIAFGRDEATDEEVHAAALAADADRFIQNLPDGYDSLIGEKGRRLSGGQRQRIAIARALLRNAPVLVLDEPTTGLDAEAGERVLGPLRRLMSGRTTVVISHSFITVRDATRIIVLDEGRIVEQGTHDQLLARNGRYAQLYRLQTKEPPKASDLADPVAQPAAQTSTQFAHPTAPVPTATMLRSTPPLEAAANIAPWATLATGTQAARTNGNGNGHAPAANGNGNGHAPAANGNGNGHAPAANGNGNGHGPARAANGDGHSPIARGGSFQVTISKNGPA